MEDKEDTLKILEEDVKKLSIHERNKFFGRFFTSIIAALARRLIKYEGYTTTRKIMEREIIEIGRRDAREAKKILKIKKVDETSASKIMKFIALLLGFKLEVRNNETYVIDCPFAIMARDANEPLIAEICSWYCKGIAQELIGEKFEWKGFHDLSKDPTECHFIHYKVGKRKMFKSL